MNVINKLVSIMVPCYNVESYLNRFVDSLINQTYNSIEIIFINDGSVDNTETVIFNLKEKIEKRGMQFKYVFQKNKGLGGAINTGLKLITGEYFCWADPDDFFYETSIEKRVDFLEKNPIYGCVTSDAYVFNSDDLNNPIAKVSEWARCNNKENQFDLLLKRQSIFCCGCHMIRTEAFLDVNPTKTIFEARRGQNWQILLPVYKKYKRFFLNECLYNYVIYQNSMSHSDITKNEILMRNKEYEDIVFYTIKKMNITNKEKKNAIRIFDEHNQRDIYQIAIKFNDYFLSIKQLTLLIYRRYVKVYDLKDFFVFLRR